MKIKRPEAKEYQQASDGSHSAVVADVIDLGLVHSQFGDKEKLQTVYLINELDSEGQPIRVSDFCTVSLDERSKLTSRINVLVPGAAELDEFDTEQLIGKRCQIITEQYTNPKTGKTFANVISMKPLPASSPKVSIPLGFVRAKDAEKKGGGGKSRGKGGTKTAAGKANGREIARNVLEPVDHAVEFPGTGT